MNKKTIRILVGLFFVILTLGIVNAKDYSLTCLNENEVIEFSLCNPGIADRTCNHDSCQYCTYIGTKGFLCPATENPNPCNARGLTCSSGNYSVDETPPTITYLSWNDGEIYNDKRMDFVGETDEASTWYYNNEIGGRWKRICRNTEICKSKINLDDGQNNITIKVIDAADNPNYANVSIFLDKDKPKIIKTLPKKKAFFDGNFWVKYTEENIKEVILTYGNFSYYKNETLSGCPNGKNQECEINLNISEFDGQDLEYWFTIVDIADNIRESKHIAGKADTTFPDVTDNTDYDVGGKYIYFNLNILEVNFDEVTYTYFDSKGRLIERKLCLRLKDELCIRKKSFSRGYYDLTIQVKDDAGNIVGFPINFSII